MSVASIIDDLIRREGDKFTNRPADRGGPTRWGITQATLSDWYGRPATIEDVKNLSEQEAREIYRERYLIKPGFLGIENESVRAFAVDSAVQHGSATAVKFLQKAAHAFPDGIFGPKTRDAVNRMTASVLYRRACAERVRFYGAIISHDPEYVKAKLAGYDLQAENALGWANRIAEFIEANV
jgi:lysozyme family protein